MKNEKKLIKAAGTYKTLLDDHCAIGDNVAELSSLLGISRNALQQVFKNQYGKGVRDYKLMTRMERSRSLLEKSMKVTEIAILLHYSKPRAFSTAFKKFYGVTPSEYANTRTVLYNGSKQIELWLRIDHIFPDPLTWPSSIFPPKIK